MNKRATYCQTVHYTYISPKNSHLKKIELRCDLYEMHHPHIRYRRTTILLRKMREQISWANWLKLENAGAYCMAYVNRTGKCGSHRVAYIASNNNANT